ncbi:hypothetical protein VNO77_23553 [Canavalia gladiata]|uniref:Uncharacterized protein n=1 Tax=Canavalia gladiata TaxID=3824 RepID=A0AAN9QFG0_CANGL
MIGSAIGNEGWNQALRGNIPVALDVIAIYEVGPLKLEMGQRFFEPLLSPYKIASNSRDPFSINNGATKGISIFCLNIKGIHKFKIAPILTYALFCSSGRVLICNTRKNKDASIQPILLAQIVIWVDGINLLGSWQANLVSRNSALSSTLGKETKLKA